MIRHITPLRFFVYALVTRHACLAALLFIFAMHISRHMLPALLMICWRAFVTRVIRYHDADTCRLRATH